MKFSRSSLVALLYACASSFSSSFVGAERTLNNESEEYSAIGIMGKGNLLRQRRMNDFFEEALVEEQSEELETMEENGDPDGVEIVDTVGEEAEEVAEMKEEGEEEQEEYEEDVPADQPMANRRKFVRYEPSDWENEWTDQIDDIIAAKGLCSYLLESDEQKERMHDFLVSICEKRAQEEDMGKWCYYKDATHFMWYNTENRDEFEILVDAMPEGIDSLPSIDDLNLFNDLSNGNTVLSHMVFYDEFAQEEYKEMIEPLVSHLRFPLAGCLPNVPLLPEVTFGVLSPGYLERENFRKIIYDYGSSDWGRLQYILKNWEIYGSYFSEIISYSTFKPGQEYADAFPDTVPSLEKERVFREYMELATAPTDDPSQVFIPDKITSETIQGDYVILKLDAGSASFKESIVQYILDHADELRIDELMWTQNNQDNYVLEQYMESHASFVDVSTTTLGETYRTLQALRNKGIRAHAWN